MPENPAPSRTRRLWPLVAAIVFCVTTFVYSIAWMYYVRLQPLVELGFDTKAVAAAVEIIKIVPGSPAEEAGLKPGDRMLAVNGRPVERGAAITEIWLKSRPGDPVVLTIQRNGVPQPFPVSATFRHVESARTQEGLAFEVASQIKASFPILFLIVGLAVLFLRPEDRDAWLLALVFAGIISDPTCHRRPSSRPCRCMHSCLLIGPSSTACSARLSISSLRCFRRAPPSSAVPHG